MNSKFLILVLSLCIFNAFAIRHHKNKLRSLSTQEEDQCDFQNYATCEHPQYIINRATGFYLGRGDVYNDNGLNAILDFNYDKFCVSKCFITNIVNNLVLDVAESDLSKRQVILWPIHEYGTGNQVWDVKKEDNGFFSIRTETYATHLALASVDVKDATKGLTLVEFNAEDPQQQWTIQE